jgi:hypothetical protein
MSKFSLAEVSPLGVVLTAAFIAIVSFGAIGGVLAGVFSERVFAMAAPVVCRPGETTRYEEWDTSDGTQVRMYCVDPSSSQERDRTILFLGVVLGVTFIVIFWIAWMVLVIVRTVVRKKLKDGG